MLKTFIRGFSSRPFKVLGLQQVAIGNLSKKDLNQFWCTNLGLEKVHEFQSEKENVDEDVLVLGKGHLGSIEVDLMAPLNPESKPKVHVPPLNHIGLWVDDLPKAVEHLESKDIKAVGGIRKGASGHDITFIHPKTACGVLLELVQAPSEVIKAYERHEKPQHPLTLVVQVEIAPDRIDEFKEILKYDAEESRKEAGCLRFDFLQELDNENKFVFYEAYEDSAAFEVHKGTPHYKAWADFKASGGVLSQTAAKYSGLSFQV